MNETKKEQPEKMFTLVALVRMPERVARGLRAVDASLAWWCGDAVGCSWEGEWDSGPDIEPWRKEVEGRWGCGPEDREKMRGWDAGFVEAGSEAEEAICRLLTMRADADEEGEVTEKVRAWEGFISDEHDNDTGGDGQEMSFLPPGGAKRRCFLCA